MVRTNSEATIWIELSTKCANGSFPFRAKSLVDRRLMDGNSGRYIENITASLHNTTSQRHAFTRNTQKKAGEQFFQILFLLSFGTSKTTLSQHTKLSTFVESLTSLPFSTQCFLLRAEFCSSKNGGRLDRESTGKIMLLLDEVLP